MEHWCRFRLTEEQNRSKMLKRIWTRDELRLLWSPSAGNCTSKGVDGGALTRSFCKEDEMRKSRPS